VKPTVISIDRMTCKANRLRRPTAERQRKFMHEFYCALRISDPEADPDFTSMFSGTGAYVDTLPLQRHCPRRSQRRAPVNGHPAR